MAETEIEMVRRHVAEGERHVRNQIELIERMEAHGHSTIEARRLLDSFESLLVQHREHLARLT